MIENKYLELLHGELDGVNSPQESAALTAYLAAHPEAQRLYEELRGMSNLLGEVKRIAPPAHLQYAVMNALPRRASRATQTARRTTFTNWLIEIFEPKFALSFAGGLAAGMLLFALSLKMTDGNGMEDSSKLFGTIGTQQSEEQAAENKTHIINHETANGVIKWHREQDVLVTEVALAAAQPFDLVITFDPNELQCKEIGAIAGAELPNTVLQSGRLQLSHAGESSYRIRFQTKNDAAAAVLLQFQRNGEVFCDEALSF